MLTILDANAGGNPQIGTVVTRSSPAIGDYAQNGLSGGMKSLFRRKALFMESNLALYLRSIYYSSDFNF